MMEHLTAAFRRLLRKEKAFAMEQLILQEQRNTNNHNKEEEMKTPKDKIISIRINKEINEQIKKDGLTVQNIIDKWVEKKFKVKLKNIVRTN